MLVLFFAVQVFVTGAIADTQKGVPILSPRGEVTRDETFEFRWQAFPLSSGLAKYEVTLFQFQAGGLRPVPIRRTTVPAGKEFTRALSGSLQPGEYAWKVEAKNAQGKLLGSGQARFQVNETIWRWKPLLGANFFRVTYTGSNNLADAAVPVDANGISGSISYALPPRWTAEFDFHVYTMSLNDKSLGFSGERVGAFYTYPMKSDPKWHLLAGAKLGMNTIPEITAETATTFRTSSIKRTSFDPSFGAEYIFSPTFRFRMHLDLQKNLSLSGGGYGPVTGNQTPLGYVLGVGFIGAFNTEFGYDVRIDYFKDGFAYTTATDNPRADFRGYNVLTAVTFQF